MYGHLDIVTLLIERGADINMTNYDNSTPLSSAFATGALAVGCFLLDYGAEVRREARAIDGNDYFHVHDDMIAYKLLDNEYAITPELKVSLLGVQTLISLLDSVLPKGNLFTRFVRYTKLYLQM